VMQLLHVVAAAATDPTAVAVLLQLL